MGCTIICGIPGTEEIGYGWPESRGRLFCSYRLSDRAQRVGDALLLLDLLQFLGVVTRASVGDHHSGIVVADHLADFLVAMPCADLEDGRRVGHEDHQVGPLAPDPPARVIGVHDLRLRDAVAEGLIPLADRSRHPTQGVLGDGRLGQTCLSDPYATADSVWSSISMHSGEGTSAR